MRTSPTPRTKFISIRVTPAEKAAIRRAARSTTDRTITDAIHASLQRIVKRHTKPAAKKAA